MIKTRTANWTVMTTALLCFAACGKKDEGAPASILPPPATIEKVPAQAEVKASSGPIELSFLLHKTQIRAGESLWQQIRIRNIGKKEIIVSDPIFHDPRELRQQSRSNYFIYVEALGPDSKPLEVVYHMSENHKVDVMVDGVSGLLEVASPEEQAMLDGWKKQGLSHREIDKRLIDFNTKKLQATEKLPELPVIKLSPGQSVETKSAFYRSIQDRIQNRPTLRPIGDFAQLDFFMLEKTGNYKIRAAYNQAPTKKSAELSRKLGIPSYPEEVRFHTPWITIEVLP